MVYISQKIGVTQYVFQRIYSIGFAYNVSKKNTFWYVLREILGNARWITEKLIYNNEVQIQMDLICNTIELTRLSLFDMHCLIANIVKLNN